MIIKLPVNNGERVAQLERKLAEYEERIKNPNYYGRSGIKAKVLAELLEKKEVDSEEFYPRLKSEISGVNTSDFEIVCLVIDDYCKTGGANYKDGTGLK